MAFSDLQVEVNLIKNPQGKVVAFANLLIDNTVRVCGFRVIKGTKGLFVGAPSRKGKGKNDSGQIVDKYYDDVQWIDQKAEGEFKTPAQEEAYNLVISEYQKKVAESAGGYSAPAPSQNTQNTTQRPSTTDVLGGSSPYANW